MDVTLAGINVQSSTKDSDPLEMKLKLTPLQRMEILKEQENLRKVIEINTDDEGHKLPLTLRHYLPHKNCNEMKNVDKYKFPSTSNSLKNSNCKNENLQTSDVAANIIHPVAIKSQADEWSANGLLKIANSCKSSATIDNQFKKLQPEKSKTTPKKYKEGRNECLKNEDWFSKQLGNDIDVSLVSKMDTAFKEETLFMEADMASKCISYESNWNHLHKRKKGFKCGSEKEIRKKRLTLEVFKIVNSYKRSRVNLKRLTSLKKPKLKSRASCILANIHMRIYKRNNDSSYAVKSESALNNVNSSSCLMKGDLDQISAYKISKINEEAPIHKTSITKEEKVIEPIVSQKCEVDNGPMDEDCLVIDMDEEAYHLVDHPKTISDYKCSSISETDIKIKLDNVCKMRKNLEANNSLSQLKNKFKAAPVDDNVLSDNRNLSSKNFSKTMFLPNFYTEHKDDHETKVKAEDCSVDQDTTNDYIKDNIIDDTNLQFNYIQQSLTLETFIPNGEKIQVSESVLRTVLKNHRENLQIYKKRNQLEKRTPEFHVPRDFTEMAMKIVEPLLTNDVKHIRDVVAVADKLETFNMRVIIKAVMRVLSDLTSLTHEGKPKALWMVAYSVNQPSKQSPFVHPRIQSLHVLLYMMIEKFTKEKSEEEKKKFVEEVLHFIEIMLLGATDEFSDLAPFWMNVGFMYSLLARHYQFLARVRQLIYDVFYCFTKRAFTIVFAILKAWPGVFPPRPIETYSNDPLSLCIIRQMTSDHGDAQKTSKHMVYQLRELMRHKYKFSANTVDADRLFDFCMERLHQSGVYEAVVLLAKRQPKDWFLHRPMQVLIDKVNSWWKGGEDCSDVEGVNAINILCSSLRPYNCGLVQAEFAKVLSLLQHILFDESTPSWMQEVLVINICHLARLNHPLCLQILADWRPSEISQEVADRILVDIIIKKQILWWTSQLGRTFLTRS